MDDQRERDQIATALAKDRVAAGRQDASESGQAGRDGFGLRQLEEVLSLDPIRAPQPIKEVPRPLGHKTIRAAIAGTPFREPASSDDAIAREAVALMEEREFGDASFRRHGCYDGDEYHQAALEAVRITRERAK